METFPSYHLYSWGAFPPIASMTIKIQKYCRCISIVLMYIWIVSKSRKIYGDKEKIQTGSKIKTNGSGPPGFSLSWLFILIISKDFFTTLVPWLCCGTDISIAKYPPKWYPAQAGNPATSDIRAAMGYGARAPKREENPCHTSMVFQIWNIIYENRQCDISNISK